MLQISIKNKKMEYYNEFHLKNMLLETAAEVKLERKKLRYLKKELLDFENGQKYLGLSVEKLRDLIHNKKIPFYYTEDKNVYFRKSELDYWLFSGQVSTTEDFDKVANLIMCQIFRC
jgi:excisionase family DNA binding protein